MVGRDAPQLAFAGLGAYAAEELTDLPLPPLQIRPKDGRLVVVRHLHRLEGLRAPADKQAPGSRGTQVAHPLGVTAGRHQKPLAVEREQVDRRPPRLAAL